MNAADAQPDSSLTDLVRCPQCRGRLEPDAEAWTCASCGFEAPVIKQVPRLAGDQYVESFGRQWNRYDVARPEEDAEVFRAKTGLD
ncbi:MAG TPA: hypothetical protein VFT74_14195, partial [Isosphaeraceae bacterium]|nr:hypothetical protein [Isosphaeraceae bacterium]